MLLVASHNLSLSWLAINKGSAAVSYDLLLVNRDCRVCWLLEMTQPSFLLLLLFNEVLSPVVFFVC